jgi:hypothetical protein
LTAKTGTIYFKFFQGCQTLLLAVVSLEVVSTLSDRICYNEKPRPQLFIFCKVVLLQSLHSRLLQYDLQLGFKVTVIHLKTV